MQPSCIAATTLPRTASDGLLAIPYSTGPKAFTVTNKRSSYTVQHPCYEDHNIPFGG